MEESAGNQLEVIYMKHYMEQFQSPEEYILVWQYFSLTRQDIQKQLKMIQDRKNQQKPGGKHHAAE